MGFDGAKQRLMLEYDAPIEHRPVKERLMVRVRMRVDQNYCPDGIHLERVRAGDVVDVPDHIAAVWLEDGRAEQDKMMDAAPSLKAGNVRQDDVGPKNVTLEQRQDTAPYPPPLAGVLLTAQGRKRAERSAKMKAKALKRK